MLWLSVIATARIDSSRARSANAPTFTELERNEYCV
jgi:hypothetical protein